MTLQDILEYISEGPVTVSEIAARTGTDAALVEAMIEMLAARGLVARTRLDMTIPGCGSNCGYRCGSCPVLAHCDVVDTSG